MVVIDQCAVQGCTSPADRGNHVWIYRQGIDDPNADLRDAQHCWIFAGCALHNNKQYDLKPLDPNNSLELGAVYFYNGERVRVVDEANGEYNVIQVSKPYVTTKGVKANQLDVTLWMQLKPNSYLVPAPSTAAMLE